jgi:hypothetical protein
VTKAGTIAGMAGLVGGLAGVRAASIVYPRIRALTIPFKAYIVTSTGTFCAVVAAERTSERFEYHRKYVKEMHRIRERYGIPEEQ